jgi:hypothetical protein
MFKKCELSLMLVCVALTSLVLIAGCGQKASPGPGGATSAATPGVSSGKETPIPEYAVGETLQVNGLTWKVLGVEKLAEVKSAFASDPPDLPANGTWLVVTLELHGKEGLAGGFDSAALKVRDAHGTLYDVAEPSGAADDYRLTHKGVKNLSMAILDDLQPQSVFAIYDVPADGTPFTLEWMGASHGKLVTLASVRLGE